jgi:hypothetical protein
MKILSKAALVLFVSMFLLGCTAMQNQQTNTNRWGKACAEWQSHANCAQNH